MSTLFFLLLGLGLGWAWVQRQRVIAWVEGKPSISALVIVSAVVVAMIFVGQPRMASLHPDVLPTYQSCPDGTTVAVHQPCPVAIVQGDEPKVLIANQALSDADLSAVWQRLELLQSQADGDPATTLGQLKTYADASGTMTCAEGEVAFRSQCVMFATADGIDLQQVILAQETFSLHAPPAELAREADERLSVTAPDEPVYVGDDFEVRALIDSAEGTIEGQRALADAAAPVMIDRQVISAAPWMEATLTGEAFEIVGVTSGSRRPYKADEATVWIWNVKPKAEVKAGDHRLYLNIAFFPEDQPEVLANTKERTLEIEVKVTTLQRANRTVTASLAFFNNINELLTTIGAILGFIGIRQLWQRFWPPGGGNNAA